MSSTSSLLRCEPRWATPRTASRRTLGGRAAKVSELLGFTPMPWQRMVWDVGLELKSDGKPAYRQVWITVPRQSGKTTTVLVIEVDRAVNWAADLGPQRIAYSAQSRDDGAKKLVNDQMPILEASPLTKFVRKNGKGIGNEHVLFKNGSRIMVLSVQADSGHGKVLDVAVLDEFFADIDNRREQAVRPAQITKPYGQTWGLSTAGTDASVPLLQKVEMGRARVEAGKNDGVAYFEWSAPDGCDPGDPDVWAACMPALGYTIDADLIRQEFETLPEGEFRRAYLNQWTPNATEKVFGPGVWETVCKASVPQPQHDVVFSVDVNPDQTSAAICVAGSGGTCGLHERRGGVGWVIDELVRITKPREATVAVSSNGPAGSLIADLERAGVKVHPVSSGEMRAAVGWFYTAVVEQRVVVQRHADLDAAVASAVKKQSGDAFVWDRRAGDVSALVALTEAAYVAQDRVEEMVPLGAWR